MGMSYLLEFINQKLIFKVQIFCGVGEIGPTGFANWKLDKSKIGLQLAIIQKAERKVKVLTYGG